MLVADARFVLPIRDIETPMAAIPDSRMAPHRVSKLLDTHRQAADVIARLDRLLPVANTHRRHHPDRLEAFPKFELAQRVRHRHLKVAARLLSAVPGLLGDMPTSLRLLKIVPALFLDVVNDRIVQRPLVSFQRYNIVRSAVYDLLLNRFLSSHRIDRDDR